MNRHQEWDPSCKVYIGGLRSDSNKFDIEDAFREFGKVVNVWIAKRPPGFGFVLMGSRRAAEQSVARLDGERVGGYRVKVELSNQNPGRQQRGHDISNRDISRGREDRMRRDRSRSRSRRRHHHRSDRSKEKKRSKSHDRKRHRSKHSSRRDHKRFKSCSRDNSRKNEDTACVNSEKSERSSSVEQARNYEKAGSSRDRSGSKEIKQGKIMTERETFRLRNDKERSTDANIVDKEQGERSDNLNDNEALTTDNIKSLDLKSDGEISQGDDDSLNEEDSVNDTKESTPVPYCDTKDVDTKYVDKDLNDSHDSAKDDLDITDVRETFD